MSDFFCDLISNINVNFYCRLYFFKYMLQLSTITSKSIDTMVLQGNPYFEVVIIKHENYFKNVNRVYQEPLTPKNILLCLQIF